MTDLQALSELKVDVETLMKIEVETRAEAKLSKLLASVGQ
jgi:hypothetical protein